MFRPWPEYIIGSRWVKLLKQFSRGQDFFCDNHGLIDKEHNPFEWIILAIDTSSGITSIAVARGTTLIKSITSPVNQTRSEKLWLEIESLLAEAGMTIRDVDLFSVCTGPGGFTGLRVGIAAAKGFASATNKPIVGITSLEAAAFSVRPATAVCALVNAYKGEVYSQLFSFDGEGVPVSENAPLVSTFEAALDRVVPRDELLFAGDAADAQADAIRARAEKWSVQRRGHCLAEDIAALACLKSARGESDAAETLKACYVRPAEAEIKLSLGLLGSKIKRSLKPR